MNEHSVGQTTILLPDLLQDGWFGSCMNPGSAQSNAQPPSMVQKPASNWWWWSFGGSQPLQPRGFTQKAQNGSSKPRISRPRSMPANLDAAGKPHSRPRPARVVSSPKLQPDQPPLAAEAAFGAAGPTSDGSTGAEVPTKRPPLGSKQQKADFHKVSSKPNLNKQLSYQERRRFWRERLEQVKAKAEKRAAAAAESSSATRKFSRHVAIPLPSGRAASSHSTPGASPRHPSYLAPEAEASHQGKGANLLGGSASSQEFLDVPPVWQGFETAEVPPDLNTCSEEQLRRFLRQAGRSSSSLDMMPDLTSAARQSRNAWEVERIMVACQWPQEVLRVPRYADHAVLKAAYRRVSMQVHPDKNTAVGASDAMSIVADAYNMLTLAGGRTATTIPAFMRQNHPTRQTHLRQASAAGPPAGEPCTDAAAPQSDQPTAGQPYDSQAFPGGWSGGASDVEGSLSHASSYEFVGQLHEEQDFGLPQHMSSVEEVEAGEVATVQDPHSQHRVGTEPHEHWNPHGHLSSQEELLPQPAAASGATAVVGEQMGGPADSGWGATPATAPINKPASSLEESSRPPSPAESDNSLNGDQVDSLPREAAQRQSPEARNQPGSAASSRGSTPDRPGSTTRSHCSSGTVGAGVPITSQAAAIGRTALTGKPAPVQKMRVTVKIKTAVKK